MWPANDELTFEASSRLFKVDGFSEADADNVIIYSTFRDRLWRIENVEVASGENGVEVTFPGWGSEAWYWVTTEDALRAPQIRAGRQPVELITDDAVDFMIVSHPDFLDGLTPLIDQRTEEGYAVRVVNVEDIYTRYSHGILDAHAIRAFLTEAIDKMGVRYVLLVGGDTYDYRDFTGKGSRSFVPTLYQATNPLVGFGAVDPLFVDSTDDGIPNAAIGRFPVRTQSRTRFCGW